MRSLNDEQKELLSKKPESEESLAVLIERIVVLAPLVTFGRPQEGRTILNDAPMMRKSMEFLVERLLLIANKFDVMIEDAVWEKYPDFCPYPGCHSRPCICPPQKRGPHDRLHVPKPRRFSLEDLRQMCADIYPHDIPGDTDLEQSAHVLSRYSRFLAELGEVAEEAAKEQPDPRKIREELADAFVRLMALGNVFGVKFTQAPAP